LKKSNSESNIRRSSSEQARPETRFIEFYSPLYLASICWKKGVNKDPLQIQKYGLLERSFDFAEMEKPIVDSKLQALQLRQNASKFSDISKISGMSALMQGSDSGKPNGRSNASKERSVGYSSNSSQSNSGQSQSMGCDSDGG